MRSIRSLSKLQVIFVIVILFSTPSFSFTENSISLDTDELNFEIVALSPSQPIIEDSSLVNLTILHINDMHGWIEPHDGYGGAATYMGYFNQEGYTYDNDTFLLLSGGDQNTGPAVGTLSKGEAVIDVMNTMNFSASCIGNHEFDFGVEWIENRKEIANFPILSCNIYDKGTTDLANFTVPYVVQNHGGINVGIIGLTTTSTYTSAHPKVTQDFDFWNFETSVRKFYDDVLADGADVVIVLAHNSPNVLSSLATAVDDLNIALFLGGHGGTPTISYVGDSMVAMAGHYATQYAKIILSYDTVLESIVHKEGILVNNLEGGVTPVSEVQQVVDYWVNTVNATEILTNASEDVYDSYPESEIGNLITDGMMHNFSWDFNFAITNRGGGLRDYFREGDITIADVVSVIPFENNILEITVTGAELNDIIRYNHGYNVYSGIIYSYSNNPSFHITSIKVYEAGIYVDIDMSKTYSGLMTDYTWWVNYQGEFSAYDTEVHYRDAVIGYFRTLDDISLYTIDGRIFESDEGPLVSELSRITAFVFGTFMLSIITISYFVKKNKKK
ncbi:MAG: bifunctional metallophosphatase/5'-nucleotidase [Candidatus Heimdallarchaeaceae archaeon]